MKNRSTWFAGNGFDATIKVPTKAETTLRSLRFFLCVLCG
jgi:hypothetical protein